MNPEWYYNEYQLSGTDFHDEKEARFYQERIAKIRDNAAEAKMIAELIGLAPEHTLLDIGAGPGLISIELAKLCTNVTALDISDIMIKLGWEYAADRGVKNITYIKSGFLDFDGEPGSFDAVITQRAFHHIPDFWKQVALIKINTLLKMNGVFYLDDVVFSFKPTEHIRAIEGWYETVKGLFGEKNVYTAVNHIQKEYSTFTWIIEGMLKEAGFSIEKRIQKDEFFSNYICRKVSET
ncbi:MAG: class I SAM-dependent methyltransferase [Brevinematales bacterium]|nr:class I SAM-dependent methyltransferase [Brevinematales bacterium]